MVADDPGKKQRVKTARGRKISSTRWLERQLNDIYVHKAKKDGYRARSAYKLLEIDKKFRLLKPGRHVVDLGAAPGSWSQVCAQRGLSVVGLDLIPVETMAGALFFEGDFLDPAVQDRLASASDRRVDLVLSDMAAASTGQRLVDRLRAEALGETVLAFAGDVLAPGGDVLIKLVKGAEVPLRKVALPDFTRVDFVRPPATRKESSELFLLARGFKERSAELAAQSADDGREGPG